MATPERVSVDHVNDKMESGDTLLVCAYDDEKKFRENQLEGAISLKSFERQLDSVGKDREIVFYCA